MRGSVRGWERRRSKLEALAISGGPAAEEGPTWRVSNNTDSTIRELE